MKRLPPRSTLCPYTPLFRRRWDGLWLTKATSRSSISSRPRQRTGPEEAAMNDVILQEISDFCRQVGLAESTFGRRAVNDGKLASRLRNGGRITTETLDRIRGFMASHQGKAALSRPLVIERQPEPRASLSGDRAG